MYWAALVVEIEADNGTVGFAVSTGGEPGAWIVERHLSRFLIGANVTDIERMWDQMYLSTLFYGRKGLVVNAISCVDLACGICSASFARSRSITSSVERSERN